MEDNGDSDLIEFLYACPIGLLECDAEGVISMINPYAMQHLLSLAGDHDPGNLFAALEDVAPELQSIVRGFDHSTGRICDGHRIHVDPKRTGQVDKSQVLSATIVKIRANRFMVTLSDVTLEVEREQRLSQAEATNLAKSQFLANMSHEIRTPLNGVLGMAQALARDALAPSQHEKVQTIRDAGRSLLFLLNDILDLSRIEAGQLALKAQPFDFEQMVKSICAIFAETAKSKSLPVIFASNGTVEGLWEGDEDRCRQILSNLLDNATKFTRCGEVRVELERSENGGIRVRVSDTGPGIDPASLPKLFSKFYQVDASSTRRFGGTGLGLSICNELTQMMGGTIDVKSAVGEGSAFTVNLPLKRFDNPVAASSEAHHPADRKEDASPSPALGTSDDVAPGDRSTLRVLAAEDNPTNQRILKALLQVFDVSVVVVDNGRLAVEAWEQGMFDLILMDIQMPDTDGVAATQRIRALEKALGRPRTPIIAVTANVMAHQIEEYERAGMDGHVAKPIQFEALSEALDSTRPEFGGIAEAHSAAAEIGS